MSATEASPVKLGDHILGAAHEPFIVAEMSGSHSGSLDRALEIVDAAAEAGAHALKIQTYTADTITIDVDTPMFRISRGHDLWGGAKLYDLYQEAHTPWEWHKPIFDHAASRGLVAFSSPFDPTAVDFLDQLDVPAFKIASSEIVDLPLIRYAASKGRPMVISTGMATMEEVARALDAARQGGCDALVVMACTASYPAQPEFSNVRRVPLIRDAFNVLPGLSDHTEGLGVAIAAVALGAVMIEKHLTLSRDDGSVDSAFSMEPGDLRDLVSETHRAWLGLGNSALGPSESEREGLRFRRSLFVVKDVKAGDTVTAQNVRSIRPANGLPPDDFSKIEGRIFREAVKKGTPMSWDLV